METFKKAYRNTEWHLFADRVKTRDHYKCLKCLKTSYEAVLQVHHKTYKDGLLPWQYPLSDCITLCKRCHAEEHNLIEPKKGWILISVDDLGEPNGICEKEGCGQRIRYEHLIYNPGWGYKIVGSTCVDYLTDEDRYLSEETVGIFKTVSKFVHDDKWTLKTTQKNTPYLAGEYKHHTIRIYGKANRLSFQLWIKRHGEKWFDYGPYIDAHNRTMDQVKEMAFIALKIQISKNAYEKMILENIYGNL